MSRILRITFLFSFSILVFAARSTGQATKGFQANINNKPSAGNTVSFRLRPLVNTTTNFTIFNFCVRVPTAIAGTFTWGSITNNTTNFSNVNMSLTTTTTVGSYTVYLFENLNFGTPTASATYTNGNSYEVFSITTSINPTLLGLELVHEENQSDWFFAIANSVGGDLMAKDNGDALVPDSYFYPITNIGGANPDYYVALTQSLPANLGDFNVLKQGDKGASLTWTTLQEFNVSHFVIEKSYSQNSGWQKIGQVKARGESTVPSKYNFSDNNAYDGVSASKTAFYRVRSVDLDAKEMIFPIRSLRFTGFNKDITIYPNPVKDGFTIQVPVLNPADKKIRMNLVNQAGQTLHIREISATQAANYYYDIKTPGVINGEYMLQILLDGELLDTKKILVQH